MFFADVVLAVVGLLVFPAVVLANLVYQRLASPADDPGPGAARRGQRDRPRVLRRRDGRQDPRPRGRGDRAVRRPRPHELRDVNIRAGRIRAAFDPTLAALPNLGVLVVLAVGVSRVLERRHRPRRRRHRRLPADDRLLPDPLDRLAARRVPAQRRRLPTGCARCCAPPARCRTATAAPARRGRAAPASRSRDLGLPLRRRTSRCSTTSPSRSSRAARSPWSARPRPARAP